MLCHTRVQYRQSFGNIQQPLRLQRVRGNKQYEVQGILDSWRRSKGILVEEDKPRVQETKQHQNKGHFLGNIFGIFRQTHYSVVEGEDEICPVECVQEIFTPEEFKTQVTQAPKGALVVCDFFKRSCGACKYIQPGFVKICKSIEASDNPSILFIKHNVFDDEEEELTDLARKLKVKMVPLFQLYKNGELVDSFPTREKKKLLEKINQNVEHGNISLVK